MRSNYIAIIFISFYSIISTGFIGPFPGNNSGSGGGGGGGGTPGGTSGQVQYNNAGVFGGFGNWNGTKLTVPGNLLLSGTNTILDALNVKSIDANNHAIDDSSGNIVVDGINTCLNYPSGGPPMLCWGSAAGVTFPDNIGLGGITIIDTNNLLLQNGNGPVVDWLNLLMENIFGVAVDFSGTQNLGAGISFDSSNNVFFQVSETTPIVKNIAAQTTLTGTAGTAKCSEPEQGSSYKKVICYLSGFTGTGISADTYTFPTGFTNTPYVYGATAIVAGSTATASTIKFSLTLQTGFVFAEGY